jgi:hypothetical protein
MGFSRFINWVLGFALIGWMASSYIVPYIIKILFTPPVSFGTNCEPAAEWSIQKLITSQLLVMVGFMILGALADYTLRKRASKRAAAA